MTPTDGSTIYGSVNITFSNFEEKGCLFYKYAQQYLM